MRFFRASWTLVVPLTAVLIAAAVLYWNGKPIGARLVSWYGSAAVVAANLAFIAFIDSKKRWPDLAWRRRLIRILTFRS